MVFLLCKGFYLCNRLLCICFAKKVISLDQYTDTHTSAKPKVYFDVDE
jgi:hypothetical protein